MKKRILIFSAFLLVGIILFVGIIFQTGFNNIIEALSQFSLLHFGILLGLSLINYYLYAVRWQLILRSICKHKVSLNKLFLHRISGFAISYLTPTAQTGGEPLRILLLHNNKVPTKAATSSVIIDKGLEVAALFVFNAIGVIVALMHGSMPKEIQNSAAVLFIGIVIVLFWFYYASIKNIGFFSSILRFLRLNRFRHTKKLEEKIIEVETEITNFYSKHLKTFLLLIPLSLIITSFYLVEHYLIASFMGVHMTFTQLLILSTLPYLAYLVPVPGGLGLLEGGHAAIITALGININAFVMVFIIRLRDLIFIFTGLVHASHQGLKMLRKAFNEK